MTVQTLGDLCLEGARKYKTRKALELCRGDRLVETVDFRSLAFRARQLAVLFHSLGIERGARIMILAENRPEWSIAVFGAALAGAVFLPLPPQAVSGNQRGTGSRGADFRELGETVSAICVTERTAEQAAALDPALPRIYLDSPSGQPGWTNILVTSGGVRKRLRLSPQPDLPAVPGGGPEAGDPAVMWPGGGQNSHRELLSLMAEPPYPRLFPRDRLLSLCPLAEKGALILAVLAAVRGGASLSCVEENEGESGDLLRTLDLLRPSVLVGGGDVLQNLMYRNIRPEHFLLKNSFTRPLALSWAGQKVIKSLGGNVRYYGIVGGSLTVDREKALPPNSAKPGFPGTIPGSVWIG
ncbi:MAG: acyl--CoA ligase [Treponema sp.]|jgi:long-chain acyl-CoA synthetase|nr:acyl--CoA ligase [Treponema sp.]